MLPRPYQFERRLEQRVEMLPVVDDYCRKYRADTFTIGIPKELEPVQAKFAMTIASKQQWLQEYLAKLNLKPGEMLPYHEEMGVTRTESKR